MQDDRLTKKDYEHLVFIYYDIKWKSQSTVR